jgi:hypothetical protein
MAGGVPYTLVDSGGFPVSESASGIALTPHPTDSGWPVTLAESGGLPVTFIADDGSLLPGGQLVSYDPTDYNFVAHGDSITNFGAGNYVERLIELIELERPTAFTITSTVRGVNGASWNYAWSSGDPIISLMDDAPAEVDAAFEPGRRNILLLFAGTNGMQPGLGDQSAADEYADFEDYLAARLLAGWEAENIYVLTALPRSSSSGTRIVDYNTLLVAGAVTHGYKIVYVASDPRWAVGGANYISDGTHPTALGHRVIAQNIYDDLFAVRDTAPVRWEVYPTGGVDTFTRGDDNTLAFRFGNSGASKAVRSEQGVSSGLHYAEIVDDAGDAASIAVCDGDASLEGSLYTVTGVEYATWFGNILGPNGATGGPSSPGSWSAGDVLGILVDADAGTVQFNKNGGTFSTAVSLSALTAPYYLGATLSQHSRFRIRTTLTYALPSGATQWGL